MVFIYSWSNKLKKLTKVFVSYTIRDGHVTPSLLKILEGNLREICTPFIHATLPDYNNMKQIGVMRHLFQSHMVLLIDSPLVRKSPWVKLELFLAKILLMPIVTVSVDKIITSIGNGALKGSE